MYIIYRNIYRTYIWDTYNKYIWYRIYAACDSGQCVKQCRLLSANSHLAFNAGTYAYCVMFDTLICTLPLCCNSNSTMKCHNSYSICERTYDSMINCCTFVYVRKSI